MENSVLTKDTLVLPENILEMENKCFHLWIDLNVKLMYTEWILMPAATEYREAGELFVKLVRDYAVECWIADSKKLAGFPIHLQKPVLQQLAPALAGGSLKKLARIIEKDTQSGLLFESISNNLKENHKSVIEVEQFITFEDAADWVGMIRG
ncbi:hypothetical protein GCM10027443_27760 [Pontibacter brevis]